MMILGEVGHGLRNNQIDFGADPAYHLDPGLLSDKSSCEVTNEATIIPSNYDNIISKQTLSKICRSTDMWERPVWP